MLFEHIGIKVESNNRNLGGKSPHIWQLNKTLVNNSWVKKEVSRKLKIKWAWIKKIQDKICGYNYSSVEREIHSIKYIHYERRKASNQ